MNPRPKLYWSAKKVLAILAACGITTLGGFLTGAQKVTGWLAGPAIDSAQVQGLEKMDSIQKFRMDELKSWIRSENQDTRASIEDLKLTMSEVPAVIEGARRRKARQRARDELEIRRSIADDRSSFRSQKGDRLP